MNRPTLKYRSKIFLSELITIIIQSYAQDVLLRTSEVRKYWVAT